jgi:hypothetical protein
MTNDILPIQLRTRGTGLVNPDILVSFIVTREQVLER